MASQNCHLDYRNSFKLLLQNFIFFNAAVSEVFIRTATIYRVKLIVENLCVQRILRYEDRRKIQGRKKVWYADKLWIVLIV